MLRLEDLGGLDAFPGGGDLDKDAVFANTDRFVQLQAFSSSSECGMDDFTSMM